jgi:hypothetical protein
MAGRDTRKTRYVSSSYSSAVIRIIGVLAGDTRSAKTVRCESATSAQEKLTAKLVSWESVAPTQGRPFWRNLPHTSHRVLLVVRHKLLGSFVYRLVQSNLSQFINGA